MWASIQKGQAQVEALSKNWIWSENPLKFSVMEAPKGIVDRLLLESRFEPKLLEKNVTKKGKELKEASLWGRRGENIKPL